VPIYYESRLAKLALDEAERPKIDPDFEEAARAVRTRTTIPTSTGSLGKHL